MLILCDLDGVVANCERGWEKEYGQPLPGPPHSEARKQPGVYDIIIRPGFYQRLPLIQGAQQGIRLLKQCGHEIVFCSIPPSSSLTAGYDKRIWVEKYFPGHELVLCRNKGLVRGNLLIDDKVLNLMDFPEKRIWLNRHNPLMDKKVCEDLNIQEAHNWIDIVTLIQAMQ